MQKKKERKRERETERGRERERERKREKGEREKETEREGNKKDFRGVRKETAFEADWQNGWNIISDSERETEKTN